jgi:hypothetical protein
MSKAKKDPTPKWRGDEVQQRAPGEAEREADRAEGNQDVPVAEATQGARQPRAESDDDSTEDGAPQGDDDADAKTAEAAEEHRARLLSDNHPPRKTL